MEGSRAMLKFFYNGLKASDGKLEKAHYSAGPYTPESGLSDDTISITAREYMRFSAEIQAAFVVVNHTDTMSDFFDKDRIRVTSSHALYPQVKAAYLAQQAKRAARSQR
jgi:hypothetical protein